MSQDEGQDDAGNSGGLHGGSQDLPEFLQTEPIPVVPPKAEPQETSKVERVSIVGAGASGAETPDEEPTHVFAPAAAETFPQEEYDVPPKSKRKKGAIIAVASLLVLGVAYVGMAWFFADRVPADTAVAGVDISGLERDAAEDRLATELDDVITSDIAVTLGESEGAISPETAGLVFDIEGTVDQLVGFSLHPGSVFAHLFGLGSHEPVITSDTSQLRASLVSLASDLDIAPVEGEVAIIDGEVEISEPEDGTRVDIDAAVEVIPGQWLQGTRPVDLPQEVVPPNIDADVIEQTRTRILDPLFSGDVGLAINDKETQVPGDVVVDAATLRLVDSTYELRLDPEIIAEAVGELMPELGESPKPARFEFKDGKPHIVPSVTGAGINPEELSEVLAEAAVKSGEERHASLELETTESEFTTEDAEALGVKERVSYFSTPVPYDPVRTQNLITGAKNLNGMLIKPGETFSLIEALGPIDSAHGYVRSGVVVNGFAAEGMGGGLSQVSTTMFNAAFEAGMEDVAHTPHSRHFERYPEGREATMYLPDLDLKWKNNTPYGVLVQAWIDDKTNVALWSTKHWDTQITTGPRTNFTAPTTLYNTASDCEPEPGGRSGFTVTVQRIVSKDGVRNDEFSRSYSWTYQPWNKVVCGPKPTDPPKDSDDDD